MYATFETLARTLARVAAYLGGAILIGLVALNCISILGRALVGLDVGLGPIRGIYDITEVGIAAAVFAFLPWCQFERGHASVDLFAPVFPAWTNRTLDVVIDVMMLGAAVIGAWQLGLGMLDKFRFGETTFIARIPLGWAYAASLVGAVCFALVAAFCVVRSIRAWRGDRHEGTVPR